MSAMEKMLGSMLGLEPGQLADTADKMGKAITAIGESLAALREGQEKILAQLERIENGSRGTEAGSVAGNKPGN